VCRRSKQGIELVTRERLESSLSSPDGARRPARRIFFDNETTRPGLSLSDVACLAEVDENFFSPFSSCRNFLLQLLAIPTISCLRHPTQRPLRFLDRETHSDNLQCGSDHTKADPCPPGDAALQCGLVNNRRWAPRDRSATGCEPVVSVKRSHTPLHQLVGYLPHTTEKLTRGSPSNRMERFWLNRWTNAASLEFSVHRDWRAFPDHASAAVTNRRFYPWRSRAC